ncbi:MAG: cell division protein FtsQ/DivIB [Pseudomonadota bacterium]
MTRRNAGTWEAIGARLDDSAGLLIRGASQILFLTIITLGLLAFVVGAASGRLSSLPERMAAMPETMARGLGLNVMHVTIKGGEGLTAREVMTALRDERYGSIIGRSLLTVDAEDLRLALEAMGTVQAASVQKLLPNTLHVSVIERDEKALYLDENGTYFVVDSQGVVVRPVQPTEFTHLPVISGTKTPSEATAFIRLLREHPVIYSRTAGIVVVGGRRFDVRFRNGFLAKLPEDDIRGALTRLEKLEAGTGRLAATLDYIDLRDPKWAYYKPKEE